MSVVVNGVVGEADATATNTLVIPLTTAVIQTTPVDAQLVAVFWQASGPAFTSGPVLSDDSSQPATPYNVLTNPIATTGPAFVSGAGGTVFNIGLEFILVIKPLLVGDHVILTFPDTYDYIHGVAVSVEGIYVPGMCSAFSYEGIPTVSGDGGSGHYAGGGAYTDPITIAAGCEAGLYMLAQSQDAGSALAWNDGSVFGMTTWAAQGPNSDSALVGTIPITGTGPFDPAGSTDNPPAQVDCVGWVAAWLKPGPGPSVCAVGGYPVFNNHVRLSD